jgi:hypothetical protein
LTEDDEKEKKKRRKAVNPWKRIRRKKEGRKSAATG